MSRRAGLPVTRTAEHTAACDPAVLDAFLARAREIAVAEHYAFVRLDPLLPENGDNRALFAARGFVRGLTVVQSDDISLLPLAPSEDELFAGMRKTTRYLVRQEPARDIRVSASATAGAGPSSIFCTRRACGRASSLTMGV